MQFFIVVLQMLVLKNWVKVKMHCGFHNPILNKFGLNPNDKKWWLIWQIFLETTPPKQRCHTGLVLK
jgi:hypothetical protein